MAAVQIQCIFLLLLMTMTSAIEKYNLTLVQSQMCFLTATSDNHFPAALKFISSTQKVYPCSKVYVYNLGLNSKYKRFLNSLSYVHGVWKLNTTRPYFPNHACAFKPIMFLEFIEKYQVSHSCRFFFYGDASVYIYKRFGKAAINEVLRVGIVAQLPQKNHQLAYTAPKMFKYFGIDREKMFRDERAGNNVMHQVQAGLLFVDSANASMKESFFRPWARCAENDDCLIPDNIEIKKSSNLKLLKNYSINGHRVFRAHRDDQSAFTFLISKHFGYGKGMDRKAFLDSYTWVKYTQKAFPSWLSQLSRNCSSKTTASATSLSVED